MEVIEGVYLGGDHAEYQVNYESEIESDRESPTYATLLSSSLLRLCIWTSTNELVVLSRLSLSPFISPSFCQVDITLGHSMTGGETPKERSTSGRMWETFQSVGRSKESKSLGPRF